MKKGLLFLVLLQWGCASKPALTQALLTADCPEKNECSIALFPKKRLQITPAEHPKYELADDPNTAVVVYKLRKKVKANVQDADYREEIVFEYRDQAGPLLLKDGQLQSTQMLFGRFCYCPGQTGYFKVSQGTLSIDGKSATLDFTVSEVPQITRQITFLLQ